MAKKRKSVATRLDEVDRTMYSTFCSAANSLSQLYTQAMNQQKLAFQAGERHALEKLYEWILRQQEESSRVTTSDIFSYLQNELDYGGEEPQMSPRHPYQHQQTQSTMHFQNSGVQVSSGSLGSATAGQGVRSGHGDHQAKNSVFANALSSPVRRSIQHYHLSQGARTNENSSHLQSRDSNTFSGNDSSMDMNADSPGADNSY
ncbi:hypothetical protein IFM89_038636 [Coptis chinensis]|uniref:Holocarboxylase synthetase n=1 Tax=Coptis chinensis TaxID=261450 RepID=A0A835I8B2_9MAGN|nr:hypothetical protein IFM89_038636 [Coptis chinensis]